MLDVDFWAKQYDEKAMRIKHEEELYPPKITMNFVPISNACCCAIPITITGCVDHGALDTDIILPLGEFVPHIGANRL